MNLDSKKAIRIARAILAGDIDIEALAGARTPASRCSSRAWVLVWLWACSLLPARAKKPECIWQTVPGRDWIKRRQKGKSSPGVRKTRSIVAKKPSHAAKRPQVKPWNLPSNPQNNPITAKRPTSPKTSWFRKISRRGSTSVEPRLPIQVMDFPL